MGASIWSTRWGGKLRTGLLIYFSVGLACALWYTFHKGPEAAAYVVRLPVGWVTIVGFVVAWPFMVALIAWFSLR